MKRNLSLLAPSMLGLVVGNFVAAAFGFSDMSTALDRSFFQFIALAFTAWSLERAK